MSIFKTLHLRIASIPQLKNSRDINFQFLGNSYVLRILWITTNQSLRLRATEAKQ